MAAENERFLERRQELQQRLIRGARAHQSDAPDLTGKRTKAGSDFDVERVEQRPAYGGFIDAGRNAYGVQRPQTLFGRRQQRETHRIEAGGKRVMMPLVARPTRFQSFLIAVSYTHLTLPT